MKPTRIGHVGIVVADLDRTVEFYERLVGLRLTERFEYPEEEIGHGVAVTAGAFVRCDATHHCISFFTLKDQVQGLGEGVPHHLAFEMATPADLLAKHREFVEAGVPIVNARRGGPGNQPRFYLRDPDGVLLEFYWGIDEIGWQGRPREYPPIEEIEIGEFDFDGFLRARQSAAEAAIESIPPR